MLDWAGIKPDADAGLAHHTQSKRLGIYKEHADQLLEQGDAYRCFCSSERLATLRYHKGKVGNQVMYDRACLHLPKVGIPDAAFLHDPILAPAKILTAQSLTLISS